jgi:cytochrome c
MAYDKDDNPNKDIARKMIQMVMAANDGFLKDLGDKAVPEKISCFTCHRGEAGTKPAMMPAAGWGRGGFSLLPAGPPAAPARGGN